MFVNQNDVKSFFSQQSGYSLWQSSDAPIKRLICTKQNSYTHLLPQREPDEFYRDTPIFTCKFSPKEGNEHFLALANEDGKLVIHDSNAKERHGIHAHNNAIFDLAWMFNEMKLVTASGDHTSKIYDIGNGEIKCQRTFCGHTRSVKTVTFRKDDTSVFATGGRDGNIILWDIRADTSSTVGRADGIINNSHSSKTFTPSKSRKKFSTPTKSIIKSVTGLVFQENNTLISCGAGDGILKIWDLRKNYTTYKKDALPKSTIPYPGNTTKNGYSSLIIDDAGIKLYANCLDNTIYCYNVGTYSTDPIMWYTGHQNSTFYVKSCLSKNGSYIMSGSSDENAYIWSTKRTNPLVKLTGHSAEVTCVAWSDKNNLLVTCSDDMTHKIWTTGPEQLPDDWEINGKGVAEILPLKNTGNMKYRSTKRPSLDEPEYTPKKTFTECCKCNNITASMFCENCDNNSKRKNSCELQSANKMVQTEFGPRRLFANINDSNIEKADSSADTFEDINSKNHYEPPCKVPKLENCFGEINISGSHAECKNDYSSTTDAVDSEQTADHSLLKVLPGQNKDVMINSPTTNLPNYVIDGVAPHLNFSPPKKKCQDWLTRLRIDKMLRQEMFDKTVGACTPKQNRPDVKGRKYLTPRSPILKYFKVTNSPHKCDGACSKYHNSCSSALNSTDWKQTD
ncbi:unnamed protein product [Phaedon cochleariae]|uniref:Protein lethal(2)denticleless n=1 Tax=Phaedon cochleariae TaxID=80249 RepID=A0A9P0DVS3_PHACE|nr:unnamed protein product [Phaedon cochleariae]